jgi:hypothetical protein
MKRHSDESECLQKNETNYLAPRIASFAGFGHAEFDDPLGRNLNLFARRGLRPMRALRFTNTSLPNPGSVKVFLAFL